MADLPKEPMTRQEEYLSRLAGEDTTLPREPVTREEMYLEAAIGRVEAVEDEVEELKNNPDVVDIVDTYADLEAYDTSSLTDKDIIRVLQDSNYNNNSTYYRWNATTNQFDFVGEISGGSSVNVVQTTGTSQTDVMSQNAVTSALFSDPSTGRNVSIGNSSAGASAVSIGSGTYGNGSQSVAIGLNANTYGGDDAVAIGTQARARRNGSVGIGYYANNGTDGVRGSVSIGSYSKATSQGEMNIGTSDTSYGYNNTNYRLLSGVHDGSNAHDAVTVGQLDGRVLQNAGAPTTATVGTLGQLLEDTTNAKLYQCTAIDTTDPNNPSYTWTEIGAGGGGPTVVQTTGTSQTDVMSQDATTKMIYSNNKSSVTINAGGLGFPQTETDSIQIGNGSTLSRYSVTIGTGAVYNTQSYGVAVGYSANNTGGPYAVALGAYSSAWERGIVSVGDTSGTHQVLYKNTPYRKIVNVYDGENPHDAATIAQGNRLMTAAPTTSDAGVLGQLWTDTTNMHTYQCTAISGSTYTWTQRW